MGMAESPDRNGSSQVSHNCIFYSPKKAAVVFEKCRFKKNHWFYLPAIYPHLSPLHTHTRLVKVVQCKSFVVIFTDPKTEVFVGI